jgi:hypothetical protein
VRDTALAEVLRRRILTQRLAGSSLGRATDVVSLLTCVQAQESGHPFWSVGMRTAGLGHAEVQAELDAGDYLRTHILRPTWHFVAASDLRWIQAVTAARVQRLNGTMYRQQGLDGRRLDRACDTIVDALRGGHHQTRAELGRLLDASGVPLAYLIMNAELEAVICSGPMRGAQQTYALTAERVPAGADGSGDEVELARRFVAGHGPVGARDFARWSSLTLTRSREAFDALAGGWQRVEVAGETLWFSEPDPPDLPVDRALLLPLFDEATLTYPGTGFPVAPGHPHQPGTDLFLGSVIVHAVNVGNWRRTVKGRTMTVEVSLASDVSAADRRLVAEAAESLARFFAKTLELVLE